MYSNTISTNEFINVLQPIKQFDIGSYVLVDYHDKPPSKLHPILKGPMQVINNQGSKYT